MKLQSAAVVSPIGKIHVAAQDGVLHAVGFEEQWPSLLEQLASRLGPIEVETSDELPDIAQHLSAYLDGDLEAFRSMEVRLTGTPFQVGVWEELRNIPAGTTISYTELARRVGRPRAVRAVGSANAANPVSIVIPCHRVIGSDGRLCGYGGGLHRKKWLLSHECAIIPDLL